MSTSRPTGVPGGGLLVFATVTFLALLGWFGGLYWLPLRQFAPRSQRALVGQIKRGFLALIGLVTVLNLIVLVLVGGAWLGGIGLGVFNNSAVVALERLLTNRYVLLGVLGLGVLGFAPGFAALLIRRSTRPVHALSNRLVSAVLGGFMVLFFLLVALVSPFSPFPGMGAGVITVIYAVAQAVVPLACVVYLAAAWLGFVHERTGPPAVATAGMVLATIGAALAGFPSPMVFALAAAAMLAWDASTYGLGVTAELGHLPETRGIELFHGVTSVGLGALVVGAAWGVTFVHGRLAPPGHVAAALAAVVGVTFLLAAIRG